MTEEGGAQRVCGNLPPPGGDYLRPAILHIGHSWGGGIARWIEDFSVADVSSRHILLRSCPERHALGARIELVDLTAPAEPLLVWTLDHPVGATAIAHGPYRDLIRHVVHDFGVAAVVVSSLVGHALDVLDTGFPTIVVLHDFYPFCPAFFAWFDTACTDCGVGDVNRCASGNPLNPLWSRCRGDEWMALRDAYAQKLAAENVSVVAPSHTIRTRYAGLFPALKAKPVQVIAHGVALASLRIPRPDPTYAGEGGLPERLRVLVPGRLSPHKGLHLLRELLPELASFADVLLLGCGEFGDAFASIPNVRVRRDYSVHELPALVTEFGPDCALLLSVLPESFSYTLSEMQALGVPAVATRLGAFAERIEDGCNGYLVAPDANDVLTKLRDLAADRSVLQRVAGVLASMPVRSATEMVADYHALLEQSGGTSFHPVSFLGAGLVEAVKRARMSAIQQLQGRTGLQRELDASLLEIDRLKAGIDERNRKVAQMECELDAQRAERSAEVTRLEHELATVNMQRNAILASTSWRVTRPLRALSAALVPVEVRQDVIGENSGAKGDVVVGLIAERSQHSDLSREELDVDREGSGPAAVHEQSRIAIFHGDPVGCRRARQLARTLGWPVTDAHTREAGLGEVGATMVVMDGGHVVIVHEGGVPGDPAFVSPRESILRCIAPTRAAAAAAKSLGWDSRIVPFPLIGEWGASAADTRVRQRELLCVPDATRLVIGLGHADRNSGLLAFARVALALSERRNGYSFVWVGGRDENWLRAHWPEIGLLVAMRRLVLLDEEVFEPWLLAADVYLGCRADGVYDAGAVEALAAGVPVVVRAVDCLPDVFDSVQWATSGDVAIGGDLADHLVHIVNEGRTPSQVTRNAIREYLGNDAAWRAFVAACRTH